MGGGGSLAADVRRSYRNLRSSSAKNAAKDLPANVVAVGNPAGIVRALDPEPPSV